MVDDLSKHLSLKIHNDKHEAMLHGVNAIVEPNKNFEQMAMKLQNLESIMQGFQKMQMEISEEVQNLKN